MYIIVDIQIRYILKLCYFFLEITHNLRSQNSRGPKSGVQNFVEFCFKKLGRAPPCPILLWDTLSISKKYPRVWSTSGHCVDTTAGYFFETAQNFDQNGPKSASGIDFTSQNVARYWRNSKKKIIQKNSIYLNSLRL